MCFFPDLWFLGLLGLSVLEGLYEIGDSVFGWLQLVSELEGLAICVVAIIQ